MLNKIVGFGLLALLFLFILVGYLKSDSVFYNNLLKKNNITNSVQVFNWVTKNIGRAHSTTPHPYLSPRHLIEKHKVLWCDEGAIVMATLDHQLGYKTRLIDLYGFDNISHHTIMEVFENGKWVRYDFSFKFYNKAASISSDSCGFKLKEPLAKSYPKFYNNLVNNNFFFKKIAFNLRGIKEIDKDDQ